MSDQNERADLQVLPLVHLVRKTRTSPTEETRGLDQSAELEALTSIIRGFEIDRTRYVLTPIMRDGSRGPPVELRALFEQFLLDTADPHARPLQ
jgi:hypothetical protein